MLARSSEINIKQKCQSKGQVQYSYRTNGTQAGTFKFYETAFFKKLPEQWFSDI